jgi:anthranilate phosphoribosyltransferase
MSPSSIVINACIKGKRFQTLYRHSDWSCGLRHNLPMGIGHYIKEIGRGKEGARSLSREQAADLLGQILDGAVSDLEVGAFCIAMRVKGETAQEMAGFLDAVHQRLAKVQLDQPVVVIPSYNGARKLPGLTTLLAGLLAHEGAGRGFAVLIHGCVSEATRVGTEQIFERVFKGNPVFADEKSTEFAIDLGADKTLPAPQFIATQALSPALYRLLQVRRLVGLRNPAHSLVKLMNPTNRRDALILSSYTHPEYLASMTETLQLTASHAMLLRGTEGESVADARRRPRMDGFVHGQALALCAAQEGSLVSLPDWPSTCEASATAAYVQSVLAGKLAVPAPIAQQVEHILHLMARVQEKS